MKLKCQCCGFEQEFTDAEAAFQAGWDAPPHFTGYVSCDLCPGSYVVLGQTAKHASAHARWAKEGRPRQFELPDDIDKEEFERFKEEFERFKEEIETLLAPEREK
jgi:hypothetical protein